MNTTFIIKSLRGKRLLTQDNMADKLKISRQAYNNYENDLIHCDLDLIMKILNALSVNNQELKDFLSALEQDYLSYQSSNDS